MAPRTPHGGALVSAAVGAVRPPRLEPDKTNRRHAHSLSYYSYFPHFHLPACLPVLQLLLPILGADLPHLRARSVGESSPMSTRRVPIDFSSGQNSEKEGDSEVAA